MTLSILFYLGYKLDWAELGRQLVRTDPIWLLVACVLFGGAFLLGSVRWWLLLKIQDIYLPFKKVVALTLIGQFFNSFLLGAAGGDVIKMLYILQYAPQQKTHATLSIIVDRAMGLFVLLCFVLAALPWQLPILTRYDETRIIADALLLVFLISIAAIAGLLLTPFYRLPLFFHRLWLRIPRRHNLGLLLDGFRQHMRSLRLTLDAIACSVAIHLIVFSGAYCMAKAIHLEVTFIQILVILSIVIALISLPISIGGHGVREGAFVLMFAVFGIIDVDKQTGMGQEPAVLFSLLFFALLAVWSLVGGWVYLTFKHAYRR